LPDLDLINPERAWAVWTKGEAYEWHFPPDVIERQDTELMHDLVELAGASSIMQRLLELENEPGKFGKDKEN